MAGVLDPQVAKTIQVTLKDLMKCIKKCEASRKVSEAVLDFVNTYHKETESEGTLTMSNQSKLVKSYQ